MARERELIINYGFIETIFRRLDAEEPGKWHKKIQPGSASNQWFFPVVN